MAQIAKKSEFLLDEARLIEPIPVVLRQRTLLIPYILVPLMLFVPLADKLFFFGELSQKLPFSPELVFWITIFFIFPHIMASSLLLLNKDYLLVYRKKLAFGLLGCCFIGIAVPLSLGYVPLLAIFGVLTVNHVIGQQVGLARIGLNPNAHKTFQYWKWTGLLLGNFAHMYIFFKSSWMAIPREVFLSIAAVNMAINCIFFVTLFRNAGSTTSKLFICSNQALMIAIVLLGAFDYSFFAILLPRVIHDTCAFMVYVVHDKNRALANMPNVLTSHGSYSIPAVLSTPLAALILAFPVTYFSKDYYGEIVAIVFALFHYYTESFVWKSGSLLRRYVPIR